MKRWLMITVIVGSLLYTIGLMLYARNRRVDADEGYYATAARLVSEGKVPYRDFFYQQAPLLPYLYNWVWDIRPRSLIAMRTLSAAFGGLTVLAWGLFLVSVKRVPGALAVATFVAVILNPYWTSWHVVIKTYAAANLLISITLISFYVALQSRLTRWYLVSGLALGLCASIRSLYGPLIPVLIIWNAYHTRKEEHGWGRLLIFSAASTIGLLPMLICFLRSPSAFLFSNFRYHSLDAGYMWFNGKLVEGYQGVGHVILLFVAHGLVGLFVLHPYFTIEAVIAAFGVAAWRKQRQLPKSPLTPEEDCYLQFCSVALVAYVLTALVPFPPYEQYFDTPVIPFLIPFIAVGLPWVIAARARTVGFTALAVLLFWAEVPRESAWNSNSPEWTMKTYLQVTNAIEANSKPDEAILSFWPGYVFQSGRRYWPGLEDNFSFRIINKVSPDDRNRYHLPSADEITRAVAAGAPTLVVLAPENVQKEFYQDLTDEKRAKFKSDLNSRYFIASGDANIPVYRIRGVRHE